MGSPLGPLMANVFMCSIEEKLERQNKLPSFYRIYVDDTLATVSDIQYAEAFLTTLNEAHPSISFTMETATNSKLPFVGMEIEVKGNQLTTCVHRKTTNKGLLLHYQRHVDNKYKHSFLKTMLIRAQRLSCSPDLFTDECINLKSIFLKLKYPLRLTESTISSFIRSQDQAEQEPEILLELPCHLKIRDLPTLYEKISANLARKLEAICTQFLLAEKLLMISKWWRPNLP